MGRVHLRELRYQRQKAVVKTDDARQPLFICAGRGHQQSTRCQLQLQPIGGSIEMLRLPTVGQHRARIPIALCDNGSRCHVTRRPVPTHESLPC